MDTFLFFVLNALMVTGWEYFIWSILTPVSFSTHEFFIVVVMGIGMFWGVPTLIYGVFLRKVNPKRLMALEAGLTIVTALMFSIGIQDIFVWIAFVDMMFVTMIPTVSLFVLLGLEGMRSYDYIPTVGKILGWFGDNL
ncbi:MAG: hypothetical protein ACD_22C00173G0004 [uncultured bacterium]|uniref:Uncharacterized protein n=1 Tax=candidate division WWE3 bacterium RBG_16_37_10 TaxID=1802610 RepID=A0A1F4UTG7_UNCKA|nr:MAG: hypothetical protein ACD_22C00173G0004 [uncultured bacterium]OGC48100.1 MAG: hypothetical protein A2W32_03460 [candidate division WWE3 bacterium RBG_16_37_10]